MSTVLSSLPPEFSQALELIDEAHTLDPRPSKGGIGDGKGSTIPYELHYAREMTRWLETRFPTASPVLQLACRAHHFRRWEIPRSDYPMTRSGYLTWRAKQKSQAALRVCELLCSPSINPPIPKADQDRVASLICKENLGSDEEAMVLEDVACLVFLDGQFDDFEKKPDIDEDKMIGILRKTWVKMSEPGRQLAIRMELSERAKMLIAKALEPSSQLV